MNSNLCNEFEFLCHMLLECFCHLLKYFDPINFVFCVCLDAFIITSTHLKKPWNCNSENSFIFFVFDSSGKNAALTRHSLF